LKEEAAKAKELLEDEVKIDTEDNEAFLKATAHSLENSRSVSGYEDKEDKNTYREGLN
jgi:hypothetical protein